ncbi:MAG: threonine/serine dehydratase [Bacteroidota bacterium]|jgi:threonine dehydratase
MNLKLPETIEELNVIHSLIKPYVVKTPVIQNDYMNEISGSSLFFKCENFQRIGAFKARGAVHAILRAGKEAVRNGVATHSSGNHAQALAYAAKVSGTKAIIVMPENSAKVKIEGVKRLGGKIVFCKPTTEDREQKLKEVLEQTKAFFIPPYNHEWVICGQGTASKELIEEIEGLDVIITPVGGGGLLSGTAIFARILKSDIKIFGAEPENLDDAKRSLQTGKIQTNTLGKDSIADGLRTTLGEKTFVCIQKNVSDILTVSESEIIEAMRKMWQCLKITAEPSCAVTMAAILKYPELFQQKRVGVIVSGGNVDFSEVPFLGKQKNFA